MAKGVNITLARIRKNLAAIPGWKTKKKLIIIESDDWGSIRMPSIEAYKNLLLSGLDLISDEGALFNKFDNLASTEDLAGLFEILCSFKDASGRPVVITPIAVVANPDFNRIKKHKFTDYYFEPFTDTLRKNKRSENAFTLWQEGMCKRIFTPQFHGREHLNVMSWMRSLSLGNAIVKTGFDHCFWGMTTENEPDIGVELMAAFDFIDPADLVIQKDILSNGLDLFRKIFGYNASYFVPPNGPFSSTLESTLVEKHVRFLSMSRIQNEPIGHRKVKRKLHWMGKQNASGLILLTRNCFFEPVVPGIDWVDSCLADIEVAFKWQNPAIISTHRVNYIGALYPENRDNGLNQLNELLRRIFLNWPEVEFITSEELGNIISGEK